MIHVVEAIAHIPVLGSSVSGGVTALHVGGSNLAVATLVRTNSRARNGTAGGGGIISTPSAELMANDPTDHRTDYTARDIAWPTALLHLAALDPAVLTGFSDDCMD